MPTNDGSDIVQDLKDSIGNTLSAPFKAVGDAVKKYVPSSLMPSPSASSSSSTHPNWTPTPNDEQKQQIKNESQPKKASTPPKYHKGTDYVPKTGPAILKKGEAVLNTKDAAKHREAKNMKSTYDVSDELGGKKEEKPKKEIAHIKTEKGKSGGYIHTHTHTHPEAHPEEKHVSPDQDQMVQHMMQNMGTPNPGETEADAGQSGVPGAGAAPPQAAQSPQPMGM